MTPMQKLKLQLVLLSECLSEQWIQVNLNQAKSKVKYAKLADDEYCLCFPQEQNVQVFEKKEIKSDFLKLFKTKTKTQSYSFGLHFYFLEQPEASIRMSLQTKNHKTKQVEFEMSAPMSVVEFKQILDKMNVYFMENNTIDRIVEHLKEHLVVPQRCRFVR